jgi:hypothetical protein
VEELGARERLCNARRREITCLALCCLTAIPCRSFDIALAVAVLVVHYDYNHHTFTITGPILLACSYSTVYNFRFLAPSSNFNKSISGKRRSMPLEGSLHRVRLNRLSDQPRGLHRNSNRESEDSSQELQGQIHRSTEASRKGIEDWRVTSR